MLRKKSRYLAVLIEAEEIVDGKQFSEAIWRSLLRLFGAYGASRSSMQVIECDAAKRYAIVRCFLPALRTVRAAIVSVTSVDNRLVAFHVIGVSGTLKSLRRKFISNP
jgi:ribonuclease P/MRP protein subunit POP5